MPEPHPSPVAEATQTQGTVRHRDADVTRQRLLQAARARFSEDGYTATTVRQIASDAGVNVALINRYFSSKEGLFEACLDRTVKDFEDQRLEASTVEQLVETMLEQMLNAPEGDRRLQLLLLLRSTGEPEVDELRRRTLHVFSERMARTVGWEPSDPQTEELILRAQLVLSMAFGILLLRSSTALEPLHSAADSALLAPLTDAVKALLPVHG